jgi:hypothetical protein
MTICINNKIILMDSYDRFKFQRMTQAVLDNRPSFSWVSAEFDGVPAMLYTRLNRKHNQEVLVIQSQTGRYLLDKAELERALYAHQA